MTLAWLFFCYLIQTGLNCRKGRRDNKTFCTGERERENGLGNKSTRDFKKFLPFSSSFSFASVVVSFFLQFLLWLETNFRCQENQKINTDR
jgi:hypothetical protein